MEPVSGAAAWACMGETWRNLQHTVRGLNEGPQDVPALQTIPPHKREREKSQHPAESAHYHCPLTRGQCGPRIARPHQKQATEQQQDTATESHVSDAELDHAKTCQTVFQPVTRRQQQRKDQYIG